jgi:hypothetical protein
VTVRVFCEREGVKESTFHFWKRELARRDRELVGRQRSAAGHGRARRMTMPALVPVTIGPAIRPPIELQLSSGTSVRVAAGCEEALLRMVLSILERA